MSDLTFRIATNSFHDYSSFIQGIRDYCANQSNCTFTVYINEIPIKMEIKDNTNIDVKEINDTTISYNYTGVENDILRLKPGIFNFYINTPNNLFIFATAEAVRFKEAEEIFDGILYNRDDYKEKTIFRFYEIKKITNKSTNSEEFVKPAPKNFWNCYDYFGNDKQILKLNNNPISNEIYGVSLNETFAAYIEKYYQQLSWSNNLNNNTTLFSFDIDNSTNMELGGKIVTQIFIEEILKKADEEHPFPVKYIDVGFRLE